MARAIPRAEWSEAEEYRGRLIYWQYLVNRWLVPGLSVLRESADEADTRPTGPSTESLQEYGWLMEPEWICEQ